MANDKQVKDCPVADCYAKTRKLACGYRIADTLNYCKRWRQALARWLWLAGLLGWYEEE